MMLAAASPFEGRVWGMGKRSCEKMLAKKHMASDWLDRVGTLQQIQMRIGPAHITQSPSEPTDMVVATVCSP